MRAGTSLTEGEENLFAVCQTTDSVRCFSARPFFREKVTKGPIFAKDTHYAPAGHLAAAKAIKRYLIDEGYVVNSPQ